MLGQLLQPEIESLIQERNWPVLKEILLEFHPSEIADIVEKIDIKDRVILFRFLPKDLATDVFEYLELLPILKVC